MTLPGMRHHQFVTYTVMSPLESYYNISGVHETGNSGKFTQDFRRLVSDFPPWRPGFYPWSCGICGGQSDRFPPSTSVSPPNSHSTDCSTIIIIIIIIYHPGLVQQTSLWPTYRVNSVSPYPKKLKKNYRGLFFRKVGYTCSWHALVI
jgi:hypothetical protein